MSRLDRFGEKLLGIWRKVATDGDYKIDCGAGEEGRKVAARLRYRLYDLRKAMELEKHELYPAAKTQTIRIIVHDNHHIVIIENKDQDLQELLDDIKSEAPVPEVPDLPDL